MKVRTTLFILMIVFFLFAFLSFIGHANVVPPDIPEDHIYILNLWFVGEASTYGPLPVHVDIYNPDSVGHRYKISVYLSGGCLFFGTLSETREGYVESNSLATVKITLFPVLSGSRTFKLHLWQDGLHVDSEKQELSIAKSDFERNIEDLSYQLSILQTALDNSNSEIDDLNVELDVSEARINKLQMQLNKMYYLVIGCFVTLIAVIVMFYVLLCRRIKSIPAEK